MKSSVIEFGPDAAATSGRGSDLDLRVADATSKHWTLVPGWAALRPQHAAMRSKQLTGLLGVRADIEGTSQETAEVRRPFDYG